MKDEPLSEFSQLHTKSIQTKSHASFHSLLFVLSDPNLGGGAASRASCGLLLTGE